METQRYYESYASPQSREVVRATADQMQDAHGQWSSSRTEQDLLRAEYKQGRRKVVMFDVDMDRFDYQDLYKLKYLNPEEYEAQVAKKLPYTEFQLQTMLGERYDVELSRFAYDIQEGKLYGRGMDEPFETVLQRGIEYRKLHGNAIDHAREEAEAMGFEKIQQHLTHHDTPENTIMLSMSPEGQEGSTYKKRFVDMFVKRIESDGTAYIEAVRKSVSLENHEFVEKFLQLQGDSLVIPDENIDAFLLAHPISITGSTTDELHSFIQGSYESMRNDHFQELLKRTEGEREYYKKVLLENPFDDKEAKIAFNALLVAADQAKEMIEKEEQHMGRYISSSHSPSVPRSRDEILYLASQQIQARDTGCGLSEGYMIGGYAASSPMNGDLTLTAGFIPFSVFDYGVVTKHIERDYMGPLEFSCGSVSCRFINKRPYGQLIDTCGGCGIDVSCGRKEKEAAEKRQKEQQQKEQQRREEDVSNKQRKSPQNEQEKGSQKKKSEVSFLTWLMGGGKRDGRRN